MAQEHLYCLTITWTGNTGRGTADYRAYERSHTIQAEQKAIIGASSDPAFRGDKTKYNPEELLVSALASCHMLWFLHLCANAGITVLDYVDQATGTMTERADGGGQFTAVTLNPVVTVLHHTMAAKTNELHQKANALCFIANSVNFPVYH
jgi:organic hydroperoxide reductase OsmC/OhrA